MTDTDKNMTTSESDEFFRALANRQRRYVFYYLIEHESTTVEELTDIVTALTSLFTGDGKAGPEEWERTNTNLIHRNLPLLDDMGFVDFDVESSEVTLGSLPSTADQLLSTTLQLEGEETVAPSIIQDSVDGPSGSKQ